MTFTFRCAHLERTSLNVGDRVNPGDVIGIMGSTGQSTNPHAHVDCVVGKQNKKYTLAEIEKGNPESAPRQLNHFIDDGLFGCKPIITTYYADPTYMRDRNKLHLGYDVVPKVATNRAIKWNRSMRGTVAAVLNDPASYGIHVCITFEA